MNYFFLAIFSVWGTTGLVAQATQLAPGWPIEVPGSRWTSGVAIANMDLDVELEIVVAAGETIVVFDADGLVEPGWPVSIGRRSYASLSVGDIDGDGSADIVASYRDTGQSGYVFKVDAWHHDGVHFAGDFPQRASSDAPVLADMNGDGSDEILFLADERRLTVVDETGQSLPGFPLRSSSKFQNPLAVGDVNGNGSLEIVTCQGNLVYCFDATGKLVPGFPVAIDLAPFMSENLERAAPNIADLDRDGRSEIILFASDWRDYSLGGVVILNAQGEILPGWGRLTDSNMWVSPSIADIDQDGWLDVIGSIPNYGDPQIAAWDRFGQELDSFPVRAANRVTSQVLVANLDSDSDLELLCTTDGPGLIAIDQNAMPLLGWDLDTGDSLTSIAPCIEDLDLDGFLDVVALVLEPDGVDIYRWSTNVHWNPKTAPVRSDLYSTKRTGETGNATPLLHLEIDGVYPAQSVATVTRAEPGAYVSFLASKEVGATVIPNGMPCAGLQLGLGGRDIYTVGCVATDFWGRAELRRTIPPQFSGVWHLQAVDETLCQSSNVIEL